MGEIISIGSNPTMIAFNCASSVGKKPVDMTGSPDKEEIMPTIETYLRMNGIYITEIPIEINYLINTTREAKMTAKEVEGVLNVEKGKEGIIRLWLYSLIKKIIGDNSRGREFIPGSMSLTLTKEKAVPCFAVSIVFLCSALQISPAVIH